MSAVRRKAMENDAEVLKELYFSHLTAYPPTEEQDMKTWREKLRKFTEDYNYHILVLESEGKIVSSVTLIIIENLTHNLRPYALIENVATHCDYRGNGFASALMNRAKWNAIKRLSTNFEVSSADIAAFGDDYNDIEMLQNCGIGVAVANALDEAKAAANFVCGSNDEDGVARWLEENVL